MKSSSTASGPPSPKGEGSRFALREEWREAPREVRLPPWGRWRHKPTGEIKTLIIYLCNICIAFGDIRFRRANLHLNRYIYYRIYQELLQFLSACQALEFLPLRSVNHCDLQQELRLPFLIPIFYSYSSIDNNRDTYLPPCHFCFLYNNITDRAKKNYFDTRQNLYHLVLLTELLCNHLHNLISTYIRNSLFRH